MPYNQEIGNRIRAIVDQWPNIEVKKMFGGVCHLLQGNIVCGVYKDYLILRLGEKRAASAMRKKHVHPFDITGRPMKGWAMVSMEGIEKQSELNRWLVQAREFVETLPAK